MVLVVVRSGYKGAYCAMPQYPAHHSFQHAFDTEATCGVASEELSEDRACVFGELVSEFKRLVQDLLVHLVGVLVVEGRQTVNHLVEEDTESPPIDGLVVAVTGENFRSEVFGSATEGVGLFVLLHVELAQTEVAQSDVAIVVQEDVLRLQVTVTIG
jgi:hypothetical protein